MEEKRPGPGVKNRCNAEQGAETIGVPSQIEEGPGSRLEKQVEDEFPVVQRKRPDLSGEGKDGVEVVGWQDTLLSSFDPSGLSQALALGQCRFRQELKEGTSWPHAVQTSMCPPSTAERQSTIARMARCCSGVRIWSFLYSSPWVRKMSATSRRGRTNRDSRQVAPWEFMGA